MQTTIRTNIILPIETFNEAKKLLGPRGLSKKVTESLNEYIRQQKKLAALKRIESSPPAFPDIVDPVAWQREMRAEDEKRWEKLGI